MPQFAFIPGRNPLLSLAELGNFFDENEIIDFNREAILVKKTLALPEPQKLLNRLGGIIKIVKINGEISFNPNSPSATLPLFLKKITEYLENLYFKEKKSGKLIFSLNFYGEYKKISFWQKKLLLEIKKFLQKNHIPVRFANKNFQNLITAATIKERLIREKTEINLIFTPKKIYFGPTIAIQDIDSYSKRDFEKPARDPLSGMLPPKLAQIIISLAKPKENSVIFDPFCGSGTILLEALLMGFKVIGSDIENPYIEASKKNILWLEKNFKLTKPDFSLFQADATKLQDLSLNNQNNLIVSEPYLGPPLRKVPSPQELQHLRRTLEDLFLAFFKNLQKNLPKISTIVIVFPCFRTKNKNHCLQILKAIENMGYQAEKLIPLQLTEKFGIKMPNRGSLNYERPDQLIGREIFRFKKS